MNKLILWFFVFFITNNGLCFSQETTVTTSIINLEFDSDYHINFPNASKYIMDDPNFATVTLLKDEVVIKSKKIGQVTLFLKKENTNFFTPYQINSTLKSGQSNSEYNNFNYNLSNYVSRGNYNTQVLSVFNSDPNQRYQIFTNSFNYNTPLQEESFFSIKGNNSNKFFNFQKISDITIQNFDLLYSSKNLLFELGNIDLRNPYTSQLFSPLETFGISTSNIKGLKYSQKLNDLGVSYSFFSGFKYNNIFNYNNDLNIPSNNNNSNILNSGLSIDFKTPFKTSIYSSFLNNTDILDIKNQSNWFFSGLKNNSVDNNEINMTVAYNMNSFAYFANNNYYYIFPQTKDEVSIIGSIFGVSRNFFQTLSPSRNNYAFNTSFKKYQGLNIGGGFLLDFFDNQFSKYNISLSSSYKLSNEFSLYASGNSYTFFEQDSKTNSFQFGSNINYFFPINVNYLFQDTNNKVNKFYQNQISMNLQFMKSIYYDFSLLGGYNIMTPYDLQGITNSLSFNLISSLKKISNLSIYNNIGYFVNIKNVISDRILTGLRVSWDLNTFNSLLFDISYDTTLKNFNTYNLSTSLSYNYNFGSYIQEAKGNINGFAFEDLNEDGKFDHNEKIVTGIKFKLDNSTPLLSNDNGKFEFKDVRYGFHKVYLDLLSLPNEYRVLGSSPININFSKNEDAILFPLSKTKVINGIVYGDKMKSIALSDIKLVLDGENEYITKEDGSFYFKTFYGKHTVRIDPNSIPLGYRLADKLSKVVNLETEASLTFTFDPVIKLKLKLYDINGKSLKNTELNILYIDQNYDEKKQTISTDMNGEITFDNPDCISIILTHEKINTPIEIIIPSKPGEFIFYIKLDKE